MSVNPDALESQVSYVLTPGTNGGSIKPYSVRTIEISFLSTEPIYSGATAFANNYLATTTYGDSTFEPMGEAFTYIRYGTISAKVVRVTADAMNDEKRGAIFPVTLALDATTLHVDGKMIRLAPGMSLTAEIKTGEEKSNRVSAQPDSKSGWGKFEGKMKMLMRVTEDIHGHLPFDLRSPACPIIQLTHSGN
jgi:hypothetical protein